MHPYDLMYLGMARRIALESPDPSTKCGAVVAKDPETRVFMSYSAACNRFAVGVQATEPRLADRDVKLRFMMHAEVLAIIYAGGPGVRGWDFSRCTMYIHSSLPCCQCAAFIIQHGFRRVVCTARTYDDPTREARWAKDHDLAEAMMSEAGVEVLFSV